MFAALARLLAALFSPPAPRPHLRPMFGRHLPPSSWDDFSPAQED